MRGIRLSPDGLAKLFLFLSVGLLVLLFLPLAARGIHFAINSMSATIESLNSRQMEIAGRFLWAIVAGGAIGAYIRLCRNA